MGEEIGRMMDRVRNEEMDSDGHIGSKESTKLAETVKILQKEVQSYKADNERMLIQLNDRLMHNLSEIQRQMSSDSRRRRGSYKKKKRSKDGSKYNKYRYSSPLSGDSYDSPGESKSILDRPSRRRRKYQKDELQGELRKIKPPIFKGDSEKGDDVEAWLLGMRKYFRIYNYSSRMEANICIHQL